MLRVWSADTPAPPRVSWVSPLSPFSAPLPGIPSTPGCFLFPLAWRAQHHQPVSRRPHSHAALRRLPSVRLLLPAASVHPRLTSTPASRLHPLLLPLPPPLQQPQPWRERVSARGREGGRRRVSPPLCLSPPLPLLRSPPLRSAAAHTAPAPRTPPAPPGQPKGASRARPRVTQATCGGTTRASSLPLPTRISWGCPLPKLWAPPTNGHRESWQRQGVG